VTVWHVSNISSRFDCFNWHQRQLACSKNGCSLN
jgi:hypothetical protein